MILDYNIYRYPFSRKVRAEVYDCVTGVTLYATETQDYNNADEWSNAQITALEENTTL